jgi:2-keto-4-pentenoate hydratase
MSSKLRVSESLTKRLRVVDDARVRRGLTAQLKRWRTLQAQGAGRAGWKLGMHLPALQQPLQIDGPVLGFLTRDACISPGTTHSLAGSTMVGVEPEVAIHLSEDIALGATRAQARKAVTGLGPALEIVDVDGPRDDLEWMLSHNLFQRAVVFGELGASRWEGSVDGVTVQAHLNGTDAGCADAAVVLGDLVDTVRFVAGLLGAFGETLRAGDRIITGSLTAPVWVKPGDYVTADFGPLGRVDIRFSE